MKLELDSVLLVLTAASWVYWVVAWWSTRSLFRTSQDVAYTFTPPVSILKPVKGLDAQAYENFASFCRQDYPQFEILFGVLDPADPAIAVIKQLQRDFPQHNVRLIVAQPLGLNRKVSILHHLVAQAQHEVLAISDSDMRVTPDYLQRVVAPLADRSVGFVNCLYRGEEPLTLTARLEALYMGATFLPSVVVAQWLMRMRLGMGATMALRRGDLQRMGGFAAIGDYLADDYEVGARIGALGLRGHLSNYVVASILGHTTFPDQWGREVRWMKCTRVSRPMEYPGLILTFSTPLALATAMAMGFSPLGQRVIVVSLLVRWLAAWFVAGYTGDGVVRHYLLWLPVRDLLTFGVWCAAAVGRRVVWRGETYEIRSDGRLEALEVELPLTSVPR